MEPSWTGIAELQSNYPNAYAVTLGVSVAVAVLALERSGTNFRGWFNIIPNLWGNMMKKRQRREMLQVQASYDFVSAVEDRIIAGEYTRAEANELYRNLKKCFPIPENFANPELLKENIKKRLASGLHAPPPLPEMIEEVKDTPKYAFPKR